MRKLQMDCECVEKSRFGLNKFNNSRSIASVELQNFAGIVPQYLQGIIWEMDLV
jgi:hypothetical protein